MLSFFLVIRHAELIFELSRKQALLISASYIIIFNMFQIICQAYNNFAC